MANYDIDKVVIGNNTYNLAPPVDSALSPTSTNPVQNQTINTALSAKNDDIKLSVVNGMICVTYEA